MDGQIEGRRRQTPLAAGPSRPASMHPLENTVPAYVPRPPPDLPGRRSLIDREENDLAPSDQILERHVADAALVRRQPRIAGIVAVVAHHDIVPVGDLVDLGGVERPLVAVDLDDFFFDAAGPGSPLPRP